jgi:uncharacterized repeat protein (TIGR04076 family)
MSRPDPVPASAPDPATAAVTALHDLRVVVDRIEGRSVCGHRPGDAFTVTGSNQLRVENGGHFCFYALSCVLPMIAAKQRAIDPGDWMTRDSEVACPDPEERLIMRIERGPLVEHPTDELT